MAVEVKYVVVRKGEEKMTFASKKEADAYDKMLDLADNLSEWLAQAPISLDEADLEALGFYLAENKDALAQVLRGVAVAEGEKAVKRPKAKPDVGSVDEDNQASTEQAA